MEDRVASREFALFYGVSPRLISCMAQDAGLEARQGRYLADELEELLARIPAGDPLLSRGEALTVLIGKTRMEDPELASILLGLLEAPALVAHEEPFYLESAVAGANRAIGVVLSERRERTAQARELMSRKEQDARVERQVPSSAEQVAFARACGMIDSREAQTILGFNNSSFKKIRARGELPVGRVIGNNYALMFDGAIVRALAAKRQLDPSVYCSSREAAALLSITLRYLHAFKKQGRIDGVTGRGGNLYYRREDVARLLRERKAARA